ncbi:MAG: homoserine kinase [Actinomycetota bacterium]|jgi:homoserine kinase
MRVVVPASSANLGPGFDVLGMALDLTAELGVVDGGVPDGAEVARGRHPAATAFASCGGRGELWVRTSIPSGRGLGFSGAVRVGAAALALQQNADHDVLEHGRQTVFERALIAEGHGDNVAASTFGGVVIAAGERVVRVETAADPVIVVWVPPYKTSTSESRGTLSDSVSRDDAVFNIARTGMWIAALTSGDLSLLAEATRDRLHQDARLAKVPRSREALQAMQAAGAHGSWLSGSGPTVAGVCDEAVATKVSESLPDGRTLILRIDRVGARWAD